jgi:hypothetical protein
MLRNHVIFWRELRGVDTTLPIGDCAAQIQTALKFRAAALHMTQ